MGGAVFIYFRIVDNFFSFFINKSCARIYIFSIFADFYVKDKKIKNKI